MKTNQSLLIGKQSLFVLKYTQNIYTPRAQCAFFLLLNLVVLIMHFGPIGILSIVAEAKPYGQQENKRTCYLNRKH